MIWRVILVLLLLGSKGLAFMPRSDCGFPAVSPLVQERDASNGVLVTYTRGRDLGGGLQTAGLPGQSAATAGGIGGLLARTDTNGSAFYHADALGNVTALINSSNFVVARYLYNPFGQVTAKWGPLADVNEMQFSSMPHHNQSGLSMYLYRAYDPHLQRWLNRDPMGEAGGINLYGYAGDNPVNYVDSFGLLPTVAPSPVTWGGPYLNSPASLGGTTATVGTELGIGALAGGVAYSMGGGYLMGRMVGLDRDAESYPSGVNGPQSVLSFNLPPRPAKGFTGTNGEYQDQEGNTRDALGNLVKDKNGNKCTLVSNKKHNANSDNPEPQNTRDLFNRSIADEFGRHRYAIDDEGVIHRFSNGNDGTFHWSGSTGDNDPIQDRNIPQAVKNTLGYPN